MSWKGRNATATAQSREIRRKKINERIRMYFIASAFTDVGELDTAVEIIKENKWDQKRIIQKNTIMPQIHAPGA
jgi:hypothetical protein